MKEFRTSEAGLEFIAKEEGLVLKVYKDQVGKATIGVGHLLTEKEKETGILRIKGTDVKFSKGLTKEQVLDLFSQDIQWRDKKLSELIKVSIDQEQFDALSSLFFNIGEGNFSSSTLLKYLNDQKYEKVPAEFLKWCKGRVDGKLVKIDALEERRKREKKLYIERVYDV